VVIAQIGGAHSHDWTHISAGELNAPVRTVSNRPTPSHAAIASIVQPSTLSGLCQMTSTPMAEKNTATAMFSGTGSYAE
jgi:hypothetical protein